MLVPAAVVDLDEAHAAFGHAAGEQGAVGEGAGFFDVRAVEFADAVGFLGEIGEFGHRGLHAEGHFILGDAGEGFRVEGRVGLLLVEGGEAV